MALGGIYSLTLDMTNHPRLGSFLSAAVMEVPLPLNSTQAAAAQLNLDYFLITSVIPSFLLESFLFGNLRCFDNLQQ